jgi:hypothetical protein
VEETLELHKAAYAGTGFGIGEDSGQLLPRTIFSMGTTLEGKAESVAFTPANGGD